MIRGWEQGGSTECSIKKVLSIALTGVGFEERLDNGMELAKEMFRGKRVPERGKS